MILTIEEQKMKIEYDKYYQTENLFGEPYPELINFYSKIQEKGKLLDLGCGQGRDSIALARLGYEVTGIDYSKVGIEQLNKIANKENLPLKGILDNIYDYTGFEEFKFILLNSMFHFGKKERAKETQLLLTIIEKSSPGTFITICIQDSGKKIEILNSIISQKSHLKIISRIGFTYKFEDKKSKHRSVTKYEMLSLEKLNY